MRANSTAKWIYSCPKSVTYCNVKAANESFLDWAGVHISGMLSTPGPVENNADYASPRWPTCSCSTSEMFLSQCCRFSTIPSVSFLYKLCARKTAPKPWAVQWSQLSLLVTPMPVVLGVMTYDTGIQSQLWLSNTRLRAARDIQQMQSLDSSSSLCKLNVGSTRFHLSCSLWKDKRVVDEVW